MVVAANPGVLRLWIITEDVGSQATVILNDMVAGASIGDIKFNIQREMRNWNN